jgi:hypothetical protein
MDSEQKPAAELADDQGNLLALALLAPFAGAVAGFIGVIFRLRHGHRLGAWRDFGRLFIRSCSLRRRNRLRGLACSPLFT